MRALALFAVLQAAPALALAQGAPGTAPSSGARPVVQSAGASPAAPPSSVTGVTAAPAPGTTTVTAAPSSPRPSTAGPTASATPTPTAAPATANPAATASPAPAATASPVVTASPAQTPAASPAATSTAASVPVAPTAAVAERLAQGDRAFGAGDVRGALFAYQDAVYLQPGYAFARVKLGRAYLALRYPAQAIAQGELALASDPASDDARRLLEEARAARIPAPALSASSAPQPVPAAAAAAPAAPALGAPTGAIPAGATVVVVMPAGVAPGTTIAVPSAAPAAAPAPPGTQPRTYRLTPEAYDAPAPLPAAPAQAGGPTAAQRYRSALDLVARREYGAAIALLDDAIALDPRLAVAYTARASAKFGQRRFREAADDYKAALGLDPALGTPLYGLAECYRLLGDPLAGELYRRYSNSHARDVREELRSVARARADELSGR